MWATLALTTALSLAPAQEGALKLTNARATYGILGQERKENKILLGDMYVLSFDIENLKMQEDGLVKYSMGMELLKKGTNKPIYSSEPRQNEIQNTLGGNRIAAFAQVTVGVDSEPGDYTLKVTVRDLTNRKQPETLSHDFTAVRPEFGFIRVSFTYPPAAETVAGEPAPPLAVPGQTLMLNFTLIGCGLEKFTPKSPKGTEAKTVHRPNVSVEMTITDSRGKDVLPKPFTGKFRQPLNRDFEKARVVPWTVPMNLNRTGKFTVHLKATDNVTGKTSKQELELTVPETK